MIHIDASDVQLLIIALFVALAVLVFYLIKKAQSAVLYKQDEFDAYCENYARELAQTQCQLQSSVLARNTLRGELEHVSKAKNTLRLLVHTTANAVKNKNAVLAALKNDLTLEKETVMKLEKRIARVTQEHDALAKEAADINLENEQLRSELSKLKQEKDDMDDGFQDGADTRWKTRAINLNRQLNLLSDSALRDVRGQFNARIERGVWDKARTPAHKVKIK